MFTMHRDAFFSLPTIALSCLILVFFMPVQATAADSSVIVADYSITPAVLQPGDLGTITATIRNTASTASLIRKENQVGSGGSLESTRSTDIAVEIENVRLGGDGVEVISGENRRIGAIGPGESVPVTFLVRAPPNDGIYFPILWIDVTDGRSIRKPIPVNVNTQIALLRRPGLTVTKILPDGVNPGEDVPVSVEIRNDGLSRADQVTVTVNSSSRSIVPKTPGTYHLGTLLRSQNATLKMVFSTDRQASLGLNPLLLTVSYANADGTVTSQSETLGIRMKGRADLGIASLSTEPARIRPGDPLSLVVRIENSGTDTANSVKASIDLPFAGSTEAFVGRIEPNNDAPAVYTLLAGDPGTYTYNLTVQYEDDYGVHTHEDTLRLTVLSGGSNGLVLIVLCILFVAAGAFWYFRMKRKVPSDA